MHYFYAINDNRLVDILLGKLNLFFDSSNNFILRESENFEKFFNIKKTCEDVISLKRVKQPKIYYDTLQLIPTEQ